MSTNLEGCFFPSHLPYRKPLPVTCPAPNYHKMAVKIDVSKVKSIIYDLIVDFSNARAIDVKNCEQLKEISPTPAMMEADAALFQQAYSTSKTVRSRANTLATKQAYDKLMENHLTWIGIIEADPNITLEIAQSLGYPLAAERTQAKVPPQANKPTYRLRLNQGEIELNAETYRQGSKLVIPNWRVSEDKGLTWKMLPAMKSGTKRIVKGLEIGKEYWFSVCYATTAGEGPWSTELKVILSPDAPVGIERPKKE